jgi:hypothetical protein
MPDRHAYLFEQADTEDAKDEVVCSGKYTWDRAARKSGTPVNNIETQDRDAISRRNIDP